MRIDFFFSRGWAFRQENHVVKRREKHTVDFVVFEEYRNNTIVIRRSVFCVIFDNTIVLPICEKRIQ